MFEHELERIGKLILVMHERHAEARPIHGGLHEALLSHNIDDIRNAHIIVVTEHDIARDGDSSTNVERFGYRLVRGTRARDDIRTCVGNAEVLEDALNHAVLAAATMERDEGYIVVSVRKRPEKLIVGRIELIHKLVAHTAQRLRNGMAGVERYVAFIGNTALEHRYAQGTPVDVCHGLLLYCSTPNPSDSRFPYCIYEWYAHVRTVHIFEKGIPWNARTASSISVHSPHPSCRRLSLSWDNQPFAPNR